MSFLLLQHMPMTSENQELRCEATWFAYPGYLLKHHLAANASNRNPYESLYRGPCCLLFIFSAMQLLYQLSAVNGFHLTRPALKPGECKRCSRHFVCVACALARGGPYPLWWNATRPVAQWQLNSHTRVRCHCIGAAGVVDAQSVFFGQTLHQVFHFTHVCYKFSASHRCVDNFHHMIMCAVTIACKRETKIVAHSLC